MRISEVLKTLRLIQKERGDLEVVDEEGLEVQLEAIPEEGQKETAQVVISAAD